MGRKAFTLIELLIVLAIIGILATVALPHFLSAKTKAAQSQLCAGMRSIASALESYLLDNGAYAPGTSGPHALRVMDYQPLHELTTPVAYLPSGVTQRRLVSTPVFYGGPPDGGGSAFAIYRGFLHSRGVRFTLTADRSRFRSIPQVWQLAAGNPGYPAASLPGLPIMTHPGGIGLLRQMENGYIPIDEYPAPFHLPINPFYDPSNGLRSMGDYYLNSLNFNSF
jgi:prepilin-type N-terminal cleavage/methylation domain-containing protein